MTETASIIRPMTLGEILDRAIRLYRQNFLKFIGIYAIPYIPLALIQSGLTFLSTEGFRRSLDNNFETNAFTDFGILPILGTGIIYIVNFVLVAGFATAALTRAVANNYTGKPISILDSYRTLSWSGLKLILALILIGILLGLIGIWAFVPVVGWLSGPGIIFFILLIVIPLTAPVIALENLGVSASVRRAWDLGRSRFWWLIGYALVLAILGQLIVTGPVYLLSTILQVILSAFADISFEIRMAISAILPNLFSMALGLLYTPLQLTMMTVVYFDLRARREGLDLALQLAPVTEGEIPRMNLPQIASNSSTPLLTSTDIGRFAILSLIGLVIFVFYFFFIFLIFALIGVGAGL